MGKASRKKSSRNADYTGAAVNTGPHAERFPADQDRPILRTFISRRIFHLLLIAVICLIAYSNTFDVPFVFDDLHTDVGIVDNPIIRNIDNFLWDTSGYTYNPRRFIGYLTFALNYRFGGLNVAGYHVVNFLIHLANGILVYLFVVLTFKTPYFRGQQSAISYQPAGDSRSVDSSPFTIHDSRFTSFIALFSALLFVAHPVQTQAVTYIVQRFTSLATMFYLASLVFYIRGRLASLPASGSAIGDQGYQAGKLASLFLSVIFAVFAMRTKEITFTLPLVVVLYEFVFFKGNVKKRTLSALLILATLLTLSLGFLNADKPLGEIISTMDSASRVQAEGSRWVYFMTEMRVIVTYIRLIFLPINQNLDYDYPIERTFFSPPVLLSVLLLLSLMGLALYLLYKSRREATVSSKKLVVSSEQTETEGGISGNDTPFTTHYSLFTIHLSRLIAFGILWFFITLSVESSFIPIADVIFEHRLYLPSVGFLIAIAAGAVAVSRKFWPELGGIFILFSCVVIILSIATFMRNSIWSSPLELWADTAIKSPGIVRPLYNLGNAYAKTGNLEKAIETYQKAIKIPPKTHVVSDEYTQVYNNLGCAYGSLGRYDEAIQIFVHVLKDIKPDSADTYNNLGVAYLNTGKYREAIETLRQAINKMPDYIDAHYNLALAYHAAGESKNAGDEYTLVNNLSPEKAADLLSRIR